jgi:hypothetical protein
MAKKAPKMAAGASHQAGTMGSLVWGVLRALVVTEAVCVNACSLDALASEALAETAWLVDWLTTAVLGSAWGGFN